MIDLQIHRQSGKIGLEIRDASYNLSIRQPDLSVRQKPAEIILKRTDPDIRVDSSSVREFLGYGGLEFRARQMTAEAREQFSINLEKSVQMGYNFANTAKKISIPEIISSFLQPVEKEMAVVPLPSIDISGQPGTLELQVFHGGVNTQFSWGKVSIEDFSYPQVKAYLEQEPYIKIEPVGQVFDQKK